MERDGCNVVPQGIAEELNGAVVGHLHGILSTIQELINSYYLENRVTKKFAVAQCLGPMETFKDGISDEMATGCALSTGTGRKRLAKVNAPNSGTCKNRLLLACCLTHNCKSGVVQHVKQ